MNSLLLFQFNINCDQANWKIVDDVVMGGNSNSQFYLNSEGNGVFKGLVSLANNGGFSSVRYRFKKTNISGYIKFVIRIKGDGKKYQFRAKTDKNNQYAYITYFSTSKDWETIEIPFHTMYPSLRGTKLNLPNFTGEFIEEFGFLIANKAAEHFELQIDKIELR